jgi:hypothetical protein
MQMATDPQFGHFGLHAGVDHLMHDTLPHNSMNSLNASTHDYMSWSPSAASTLQSTILGFSSAMNAYDFMTWNIETPPLQYPTSNRPTMYTRSAAHQPAEQGRIVEEGEMMLDPKEVSSASNLCQELRHPTPLDWARWKPIITAKYKNGTALMILKELEAEGFRVT